MRVARLLSAVTAFALVASSGAAPASGGGRCPKRHAGRLSKSSATGPARPVKLPSVVSRTTTDARRNIAARAKPATREQIVRERRRQLARAETLASRAAALDEAILNHEASHVPSFAAAATVLHLKARLESSRASYSVRKEKNEAAARRAPAKVRRNQALLARGRAGERGKSGYLLGYDAADPWAPIRREEAALKQLADEIQHLESVAIPEAEDQLAEARSTPSSPLGDALTHYMMMKDGIALRTGAIKIGRGGRWTFGQRTRAELRKAIRSGTLARSARSTYAARYGYDGARAPRTSFPRELLMDQKTNRTIEQYSATWGERFDGAVAALTEHDTVLEVGPGSGTAVRGLLGKSKARVVAVERGEDSRDGRRIAELNQRIASESQGRATFIEGNIIDSASTLDGGKVSMVMDYFSAIATEAPGALMTRYGEVTRPGGHVFLTLPPHGKVWIYPADGGKPTELLAYLGRVAGFEIVESGFRVRDAGATREDGVGRIRERYAILKRTTAPVSVKSMRQIASSQSSVNSSKTSYSNFGRAYIEQ